MTNFDLYFPDINYHFPMVFVQGTAEEGYLFGVEEKVNIRISDFYISKFPVTQQLWEKIMGTNPSDIKDHNNPVDNVSFNDITCQDGFLAKLNAAKGHNYKSGLNIDFRLPTETEWEYAARGGINWRDDFLFSGSNDIDTVGWYENNAGPITDRSLLSKLRNTAKGTAIKEVGLKQPNQLGIHDMCGNVWEWCQDYFLRDIHQIPNDGSACSVATDDRVLRGGCHHNWAVHCTVSKRYEIVPDAKDGCIGFRIAGSIT